MDNAEHNGNPNTCKLVEDIEEAYEQAISESIERWSYGGPPCAGGEICPAGVRNAHTNDCPRKAYLRAGHLNNGTARYPQDVGRVLSVAQAHRQAIDADRRRSEVARRVAELERAALAEWNAIPDTDQRPGGWAAFQAAEQYATEHATGRLQWCAMAQAFYRGRMSVLAETAAG